MTDWHDELNGRITSCEKCPRLRSYCQEVALKKRRSYQGCEYWGRPVPNFGDPSAEILIVGLAPGAHGANRTGRMFTGDESGNWLFRALFEAGLANQPASTAVGDGLHLDGVYITAAAHCAPPGNKPAPDELANCRQWLVETFNSLESWRLLVALGRLSLEQSIRALRQTDADVTLKASIFSHGAEAELPGNRRILCSYHPSQQNTFTKKLTRDMLRGIFIRASSLIRQEF